MTVNALILAAGHGTRMGKISEELAKPAICVAGEPIVSRLLRQLLQLPEISTVYINSANFGKLK
jgi:choline kinase